LQKEPKASKNYTGGARIETDPGEQAQSQRKSAESQGAK